MGRVPALAVLLALTFGGCSAVTEQWVTPDFEQKHRLRVWRVHVQAHGVAADKAKLGQLWTLIAQRWVNHHRDFIAKYRSVSNEPAQAQCKDDTSGVLTLKPTFSRTGDDVQVKATAALMLCKSKKNVWTAAAAGTWGVDDDQLKSTTERYAKELGADVTPWVPATFRLLRELLDTMPRPKLKDDDAIMEKIDLED